MGEDDKKPVPDDKKSETGSTDVSGIIALPVGDGSPGGGGAGTKTDTKVPEGQQSNTSGQGADKGVSNANSSGTQRSDATTTSTSGGSGARPEGHQATGKPGDGGGDAGQTGQPTGGGTPATKVTPSAAADKLIPDKPKPASKTDDEPKFRGPAPLRRWKKRHYDAKKAQRA